MRDSTREVRSRGARGPAPEPQETPAQAAGNRATARALSRFGIHPKLSISQPGDPEEEEAERVANAVVGRAPLPTVQRKCACSGGTPCAACEEEKVHAKTASAGAAPHAAGARRAAAAVQSGGNLLPRPLRSSMESRFARDLSSVRVHTDGEAGAAARAINARAFTVGHRIAFAPGEFRPHDRDGLHLLAHELAHVAQSAGVVHRQAKDPGAPPAAAKSDAAPSKTSPPATKGYTETLFRGITVSESKEQVVFALKAEVARSGRNAADSFLAWLEDYAGPGLEGAKRFKRDFEADPSAISGGVPESAAEIARRERVRDTLLPVVRDAVATVDKEAAAVVADFEQVMKANALQTLAASKRRAEAERLRYGVTTTKRTEVTYGGKAPVTKEVTTHSIMDVESPAVKGLRAAATLLLARRKAVHEKEIELNHHVACAMGICGHDRDYDRLAGETLAVRKDYISLHQALAFEYPLLDRIGVIEETYTLGEDAIWASNELERLASGKSDTDVAMVVGEKIQETLDHNETARQGVEDNRVNLWRQKDIFGLAKTQTGVESDLFKSRILGEKWTAEQPHIIDAILEGIALLVFNIGAILLAAPTGGASLVVAFGVNAALAVEHTREYLLNKGVAGSDLRRAQALSQDDPSFLWLAIEIIGVGLDGVAAVHALKTMRPLVQAVQAAGKEGAITADGAKSIKTAAEALQKPELAEKVIEKLPKGNVAALESLAPASKAEIGEFAKTTAAIEKEAATGFGPAARSALGSELNISKAGHIWSCHSPCTILREKFAQVFATDEKLLNQLTSLESRAASATKARAVAKDAQAIADAESELATVKKLAADLEGTADDALRTIQNPTVTAGLKDIAESTTHTAPRLIPAARVTEVAGKLGAKFPLIKRLSDGAVERVVRAAMAAAEGGGLRRAVRGLVGARAQLLEELSAARVRALLATAEGREALGVSRAGERAIFIEGSRIRDAGGAMLTDGIIAVQRGDRLEIVAVLEAKAGRFAAEGLAESLGGLKRASTSEIIQALFEASGKDPGVLAAIAKADPALHQVITTTRGANLAANEAVFRDSREALMAALENLPDAQLKSVRNALKGGEGQVSRDIERLLTDENRTASLIIDGQPVTAWSPQRPQFLGAVPKGVDTTDIAAQLAKEKFDFKALDFGNDAATKAQLDAAAKAIVEALEGDAVQAAKVVPP